MLVLVNIFILVIDIDIDCDIVLVDIIWCEVQWLVSVLQLLGQCFGVFVVGLVFDVEDLFFGLYVLCWIVCELGEQFLLGLEIQLVLFCVFDCQLIECFGELLECVNILFGYEGVFFGLVYILYLVCLVIICCIVIGVECGLFVCVGGVGVWLLIGWGGVMFVGVWVVMISEVMVVLLCLLQNVMFVLMIVVGVGVVVLVFVGIGVVGLDFMVLVMVVLYQLLGVVCQVSVGVVFVDGGGVVMLGELVMVGVFGFVFQFFV